MKLTEMLSNTGISMPRAGTVVRGILNVVAESGGFGTAVSCQTLFQAAGWLDSELKPVGTDCYKKLSAQAKKLGLGVDFQPADGKDADPAGAKTTVTLTTAVVAVSPKSETVDKSKNASPPAVPKSNKSKAPKATTPKATKGGTQANRADLLSVANYVRIYLCAFDSSLLDNSVKKIVNAVTRAGSKIRGPIPLPVKKSRTTILISPHKYKDARDQYEIRTHRRLIDIVSPSQKAIDELLKVDLSSGVDVRIDTSQGAKA